MQQSGVPTLAEDATPLSLRGLRPTPPRFTEGLPHRVALHYIVFGDAIG
jgi:hypothetical protein